jgi:hypothetical protein
MLLDRYITGREQIMILHFITIWKSVLSQIQTCIKCWTKPATAVLATGFVFDLSRKWVDLLVENALLRQQLIVLKRQVDIAAIGSG